VADRFGRRIAIILGCAVMIIAAILWGASQNLVRLKGGRFLMGIGNSMAQLSSPLLLTELCHPQHRGRVTDVYISLWNIGVSSHSPQPHNEISTPPGTTTGRNSQAIVNTWLPFGTKHIATEWSWRIPTIVQGFPWIVQIAFIWFIPESASWVIAHDRAYDALCILAKYHANGDQNHPTARFEYAEIK
jgi:MFS family permease